MELSLAEVQSTAEHCSESTPLDQTRFTFSIIETRAAAQTDSSDVDVLRGKHEEQRWKEGREGDNQTDRLVDCATVETERNSKICGVES